MAGILLAFLAGVAALQSGPVGYYKGDDTPPVATDSSPNARTGTYTNGATTNPSIPALLFPNATSMSFDGTDDFVGVAGFPWATGGPVTIAFWNFVATGTVQNSSAFTIGSLDTVNRFHAHAPWSDNNLYWDYGDLNTTGRIFTSYAAYINLWTHVALVSEGNGGAFKAIYLNGTVAISAASSDGPDVALTGLEIGSWGGLRHRGLIDDFRIYNRVLTAPQIQMLAMGNTEPVAPVLTLVVSPGQANLSWAAVPGAASYTLEVNTGSGYSVLATGLTGTSYVHTGIPFGTTVTYRMTAVGISASPYSAPVSGIIPFPPPRFNDHSEGLFDDRCSCGSVAPRVLPWGAALAGLALLLAIRRR